MNKLTADMRAHFMVLTHSLMQCSAMITVQLMDGQLHKLNINCLAA